MTKFILIFIVFLFSFQSFADCSNSGLWLTNKGENINQNTLIIINGYANSERIIHSLSDDYKMYLISGDHKVKLTVKSTHKGMFRVSQAILEHSELLKVGKVYSLDIRYKKKGHNIITNWNSKTRKDEPLSWKVEESNDYKAPEFLEFPKYSDKEVIFYGCGPGVKVIFDFRAEDESEILVLTELIEISTGKSYSYYLSYDEVLLSVGHGMCSGPFKYKSKEKYKIRFQLMDSSGNLNKESSPWLNFDSPM